MADSVMTRPMERMHEWAYEHAVILKGIEEVWHKTGNIKYFNFIKETMDTFVAEDGTIKYYNKDNFNIDNINNGKILMTLYKQTKEDKYKKAIDTLYAQLLEHPRTSEGVFWHKKIYPYQIWLDGLYMGAPFYASYLKEFGHQEDIEDVIKQFILSYKYLRDEKTGLLQHAYDETREQFWCDKETGLSHSFWGRSIGWYVMALVDVLDYVEEDHPERKTLINMLQASMDALIKVQDKETGVWYQVLDKGNEKGNYLEASASCMFVYAMAKGIRKGYLGAQWLIDVKKAYNGLIEEFIMVTNQGLVNLNKNCMVAGLGGDDKRDGSYAYYISEPIVANDGKGVGAFIMASIEIEKMCIRS